MRPASWIVVLAAFAAFAYPGRALGKTGPADSWRPEVMATVGISSPLGSLLSSEVGSRYPIGLEARARSDFGIGGAVSSEVWWRAAKRLSGALTTTVEFSYAYPVLEGALVPFGGICARYSYSSLRLGPPDDSVTAVGSGFGVGPALGLEAPLGSRFTGLCRMRLILGEAWLTFSEDFDGLAAGENQVGVSAFEFGLGISFDLLDACMW
ncbi:MAG: hypothetical protein JSU73_10120 [candidate division WOR-3 bacterium]|nr:MAG: hypothetical protein JSU73_10120 [candidate division WOR-3 bacterium]